MTMFWLYLTILIIVGLAIFSLLLFGLVRWLGSREPYSTFMRLRTRRKISFFRLMLSDRRVPLYVKAIPVGLVVYLSIPFDIIPDFVPVLGYLDDVAIVLLALALIIRLSPRTVVLEVLHQAGEMDTAP
jgi:uncharacterized membrane protein YkvA (DUF1232 family)